MGTGPAQRRANLIHLRKALALTQTEMSGKLGMSLGAYQKLENGPSEARVIHILASERIYQQIKGHLP